MAIGVQIAVDIGTLIVNSVARGLDDFFQYRRDCGDSSKIAIR